MSQAPIYINRWKYEHVLILNIEYKNVENINEIIQSDDLIKR